MPPLCTDAWGVTPAAGYSKWGPWTEDGGRDITRELVRNAETQAPPQTSTE